MGDLNHKAEFIEAVQRSKRLGLSVPDWQLTGRVYFQREGFRRKASRFVTKELRSQGILNVDQLVAKCILIHQLLLPPLNCYLRGAKGFLTIGSVTVGSHTFWEITEEKLREWLRTGITAEEISNIPFHLWITMDSMEIVDATFLTTSAYIMRGTADRLRQVEGGVILGYPSQEAVKHHPFVVGDDLLAKIRLPWSL